MAIRSDRAQSQRRLGCPACGNPSAGRCSSIAIATTAHSQDAIDRAVDKNEQLNRSDRAPHSQVTRSESPA
eukprot:15446928-Alexandrium_andersonii.AAC.1